MNAGKIIVRHLLIAGPALGVFAALFLLATPFATVADGPSPAVSELGSQLKPVRGDTAGLTSVSRLRYTVRAR